MQEKITEQEMLRRFQPGNILLSPLIVRSAEVNATRAGQQIDALIELAVSGEDSRFRFVVEVKSRGTLEAVHAAAAKARTVVQENEWPMIQVPYLAPDRLDYLEANRSAG